MVPPCAFAEDYARDANSELAVTLAEEGSRSTYEIRLYGGPEAGYLLLYGGDLKAQDKGVFVDEREADGKGTVITLQKGQDGKTWIVHGTGLNFTAGPNVGNPANIDGNYNSMTHAERVARAQKRWQEVDAILNTRYDAIRKGVSQESAQPSQ